VYISVRIRPIRELALTLACLLSIGTTAFAQQAPTTLSLEEAIAIARRNNPDFLSRKNDEVGADWAVRESYGALLPSASVGGRMTYQGAGVERLGLDDSFARRNQTGYLSSSYSVGLDYRLAGDNLMAPKQQRANRTATVAQIEVAGFDLATNVTRQYLAVRRARDGVILARQVLERAIENQRLVDARVAVGSAIALDSRQAEVERGRAEVDLLRAENLEHTEKLRLVEALGIELDREITLTSEFPVFEPEWSITELTETAMAAHPQLQALRAQRNATGVGVRIARSQYRPSLSFSAGLSGYDQRATNTDAVVEMAQDQLDRGLQSCEEMNLILSNLTTPMPKDCSPAQFQLGPNDIARLRDANSGLPLDFVRQPFSASLTVSLPIFNGFSRERRLATARVADEDARHNLRREELRLKTQVATTYQDLVTAYRAVRLEERNRAVATDNLTLARERYSVGTVSFIELKEAETSKARADQAHLVAIYIFHESLATLETAVGRKLDHK
jgi:outer membrane protein